MTLMGLRRSLCQRSRSTSDGRRNIVNVIAHVPLTTSEPKLTQIFIVGPRTGQVFKVMGSRSRSQKRFPAKA